MIQAKEVIDLIEKEEPVEPGEEKEQVVKTYKKADSDKVDTEKDGK